MLGCPNLPQYAITDADCDEGQAGRSFSDEAVGTMFAACKGQVCVVGMQTAAAAARLLPPMLPAWGAGLSRPLLLCPCSTHPSLAPPCAGLVGGPRVWRHAGAAHLLQRRAGTK